MAGGVGHEDRAEGTGASYKRPFDLGVVALAAVLLPVWVVPCIAIPLAIRLEGPEPVLHR